uniref:LPD7 domain-containing protein n=1 Tax=Burkholderia alba TaxID=2683677 RepID=UPI003899452B
MDMPIEEARDFVQTQISYAEEQAAAVARDDFFSAREQLPRPAPTSTDRDPAANSVRVTRTDEQLGRAFRDAVQSIATSITLHGAEVNQTLALSNRLDELHSEAWRKSGQTSDGDRAIGEMIRTGSGFAGELLPARSAQALNTIREEAGLPPLVTREPEPAGLREAVRERQEEIDAENTFEFGAPVDPPTVEREPEPDPDPAPDSPPPIGALAAELLSIEARILLASRDEAPRLDATAHEKTVLWLEALTGPHTSTETLDASVRVARALAEHDGPSSDNPFTEPGLLQAAYADQQRMMLERAVTPPAPTDDVTRQSPSPAANDAALNPAANDPDDRAPIATTDVKQTDRSAANEGDARNPANDPVRPTPEEAVSPVGLASAQAARTRDRADAEQALKAAAADRSKLARPAEPAQAPASSGAAGSRTPARSTDTGAADNSIELEASQRKPVLSKDGYDVPAAIAARYLVKDGRFWTLDTRPGATPDVARAPHFEDTGPRLKSSNEDRATIADMIAIAKTKNWDSITVKGSETFRRNTWIEASLAGVEVNGFKPGEADQALLAAAKRDRDTLSVSGGQRPDPAPQPAAAPKPAAQPSPSPAADPAVAAAPVPRTTPAPATSDTPTRQPSVAETRAALAQALEKLPPRSRAEILNRFDARLQAGLAVDERVKGGELKPDQVAGALDERSAALHQAWHAPKVAPTTSAQPEQKPARAPKVM